MRVLATAGHVDHGKSTLVEALTGTHPDRLKEERDREMTIDLGFGYFTLPDGTLVGIIDVPGHRDFIDNMLAGVGGVDAALFVIAADEGPMPQTREHLAILDLLGVRTGIVALTKIDLVQDADWLALMRKDVENLLQPTSLRGVEILPISARTGEGMPELKQALARFFKESPSRPDFRRPRLPVDRSFSLMGFGTVVTGTLLDGSFHIGEEVEILPGGKHARIRGLQTHNKKIERAEPGGRLAVNLSGVEPGEILRGQVVVLPGTYAPSRRMDLRVRMLADSAMPLKHDSEVKLYLGTAETMARARILGADMIAPGDSGWAQFILAEEMVAAHGDRAILRRPSPGSTIGGGTVIEPHLEKLHRRFDAAVTARLEALDSGGTAERILQALADAAVTVLEDVLQSAGMGPEAQPAVAQLIERGELLILSGDPSAPRDALVCSRAAWERLMRKMEALLGQYHREHPLRAGMPREALRARAGIPPKAAGPVLARAAADGMLVESAHSVRLTGFERVFTPAQRQIADTLLARFAQDPFQPPSVKDCLAEAGEEVYTALVEGGKIKPLSDEVVFLQSTYEEMTERLRDALRVREKLTVAEVRDLFGSSRKYILAFLEYLDAQGVTRREGDYRRLK
ncbi:MAG: selenocysteine-specific translation elongation factor [Anaerolineales bacterium]